MTVEMDEIDGRVLRCRKRSSANLEDFISDSDFAHHSIPLTFFIFSSLSDRVGHNVA